MIYGYARVSTDGLSIGHRQSSDISNLGNAGAKNRSLGTSIPVNGLSPRFLPEHKMNITAVGGTDERFSPFLDRVPAALFG